MEFQAFSSTSISPDHILSALLDYTPLKGRGIPNSLFKSFTIVPRPVLYAWKLFFLMLGNFYGKAFCISKYATNLGDNKSTGRDLDPMCDT